MLGTHPRNRGLTAGALFAMLLVAGCSSSGVGHPTGTVGRRTAAPKPASGPAVDTSSSLPGMPAVLDSRDIYSADRAGRVSPAVHGFPSLVYVPNSKSNTVDVIDPRTYRIVAHYAVGKLPQHVVPSYDLKTLWVNNNEGNSLTPIDPRTGRPGPPLAVEDPYNLYCTPDGRFAMVMAERLRRIDFRDVHTMRLVHSLAVPCAGVNHADFSADGRYFLASCEFSGSLIKVDTAARRLLGVLPLAPGSMPQDVKLSADGRVFYVADMMANGLWEVDGATFRKIGFLPTGKGVHGLYVSRDSRYLYASNRGEGSVSVIDLTTRKVARTWRIPGGGSPDMGGISADGGTLWLSGRYDGVVYAIDTSTGRLLAKIPVGDGPHGLCVYPQPGRYSLGHTGIFR